MFINLTNHSSKFWEQKQLEATKKYGEIKDFDLPEISGYENEEDIQKMVDKYFFKIIKMEPDCVLIQGEYTFTYRLIFKLLKYGIRVVAASSSKRSIEYVNDFGRKERCSEFEFIKYREYQNEDK